jgi:hypothetical protein
MTEQFKKLSEEIKLKIAEVLESAEFKDFAEKTKAAEDSGTFEVVISTADVDRQGESIDQAGWDLDFYNMNPVVLWAHDYWSLPIGVCDDISVVDGKLIAKGRFAPEEANPFAQQVRRLYDAKMLRTTSVGFIPEEMEDGLIKRAQLLEFSFVPVPANPYALSLRQIQDLSLDTAMLKMKGIEVKEEERMTEEENKQEETEEKPKIESEEAKEICSIEITKTDNVITLVYTDGSKSAPMKMTEDFETELEKIFFKAGRVLSDKNRALIQNCVDNMKNSIVALEELLTATESSEGKSADNPEGNEGEEQPEENPDAPKERSKDGGFDEVSKALDAFLVNRQVLRSAVNALSGSLESLNKKIKENRKK